MRMITFSADEDLIRKAHAMARAQGKTLNAAFREWLLQFATKSGSKRKAEELMKRLRHVKAGRCFTREQMNDRLS